ncbi:MAG: type IX secretion system membrane protein PorP/SprF [Bacteroidia bacterium]|nr:type IX secretion system membrane protein PorP/SprF [Bacteroidia bacterium]
MRKLRYIVLILLCGTHLMRSQQQTVYTSYLLNPYLYNPAYAGVVQGTQFTLGHRNQWVGFDGAPKVSMLSGWGNFKKKPQMAAGGMVISDRSGLIQRTAFQGSYAYHLKFNKKYAMSFGLAFGGVQYNVKLYDAKPYDQDDNFLSSEVLRAFAFDANAGVHFYSKEFFLGLSNQQMLNSKIRWSNTNGRLSPHYYAYTGYNFRISKDSDWVVQPSVLVRMSAPVPHQFEYHLRVIYNEMIWIGGSFREKSSASVLFGCNLFKALSLSYAYDFTTTDLSNYSSGSQEICVSYLFPFKRKKSAAEMAKEADETELNTIDNSIKTNLKNKKKTEKEAKKKAEEEAKKKEEAEKEKKPEEPKVENPESKDQENKEGEEKPERE